MPSRRRVAALAVLTTVAALAGCGGSDDNGDEASTTTSVPAETETTTMADNTRLSAASWATYQTAAARAQKVNQSATAVFRRCSDKIPTAANGDAVDACMGGATSTVVKEGMSLLQTLDGLQQA